MFDSWMSAGDEPIGLLVTRPDTGLDLDATIERLLAAEPGPSVVTVLGVVAPLVSSVAHRAALVAVTDRLRGWTESLALAAVAELAGPLPDRDRPVSSDDVDEPMREEVMVACGVSSAAAQSRIDVARWLRTALPGTADLLHRGRLSWPKVRILAEVAALATGSLPAEAAEAFAVEYERRLLPTAPDLTPSRLRARARAVAAEIDPASLVRSVRGSVRCRGVRLYPQGNGTTTVQADLADTDAAAVWQALDTAARATDVPVPLGAWAALGDDVDDRGIDARRADALVNLLCGPRSEAGGTGPRVEVGVVIELPTLLDLRQGLAAIDRGEPAPSELARRLATCPDASLRRLVTEPLSGELLDLGRRRYTPGRALADFVRARSPRCTFPGCHQPAQRCDLDHIQPFGAGGPTIRSNLAPLCRRHHRMKTRGAWRYRRNDAGGHDWVSTGTAQRAVTPPEPPIRR